MANKTLLIVGGVAVLGIGAYLLTRPKKGPVQVQADPNSVGAIANSINGIIGGIASIGGYIFGSTRKDQSGPGAAAGAANVATGGYQLPSADWATFKDQINQPFTLV